MDGRACFVQRMSKICSPGEPEPGPLLLQPGATFCPENGGALERVLSVSPPLLHRKNSVAADQFRKDELLLLGYH